MATTIESNFAQVSPLLDDAMQRIEAMQTTPQERAAVMALAMTYMSVTARKRMIDALFAKQPIDQVTAEQIAEVLSSNCMKAEAEINEYAALYFTAGRLQ